MASSSAEGSKSKGSIYIRGIKGDGGFDSYKFILEKAFDFHELDIQILLKAYEEAFRPKQNQIEMRSNTPNDSVRKPIKKQKSDNPGYVAGMVG